MNPESRTMLPKQAFTGFAARYSPPNLDEGFTDITKVDFEVSCILVALSNSATQAAIGVHGSVWIGRGSVELWLSELSSEPIIGLNTIMHFNSYMPETFAHGEHGVSLADILTKQFSGTEEQKTAWSKFWV